MNTITRADLIKMGYGPSVSRNIIKHAKEKLVNDGFFYYDNPRLGRVPLSVVEEILGLNLKFNIHFAKDSATIG
ncbi:DUF3173 family protein [Listeria booriae]|uniref:DUF3173 family protein n=1 Tax=Listeria booriae TaxID=1552123 RepID=A0A7X1DPS9_9LIST|nr:DUF3173 domain-containing protein [Listeria booriae]MBC1227215.1 DUF3173 family protein [Listeria booriae]MBC2368401.1 DUF3173 family protein [Listeria booriae]MBC2370901.1 DUF3173 family protein [Listeria booriae]